MKEIEQQLKFTSTTIVGCKSLAANRFSQHVSPEHFCSFRDRL